MAAILKLLLGPLGSIAFGVSALVLGFMLLGARVELSALRSDVAALEARIDDPLTGFVARLAQCQTNVNNGLDVIERNNADIAARDAEAARHQAEFDAVNAELRRERAEAERRVGAILAATARPNETVCAFADRIILERVQ